MNNGVQVSAALAQLTGQVVCMQRGVNGQGYYTCTSMRIRVHDRYMWSGYRVL